MIENHESWNPSWRTPYEEDVFQKNKRKAVKGSENTVYDSTQWRSPRRWVWPSELPKALEVSDLTPRPNVPCCHAAMLCPAPVLPVPPVPCLSWRGPQYLDKRKKQRKLRSSTRRRWARQASCEFLDGRILVLHHLGEITGEAALGQSSVKWRSGLSVLSVLSVVVRCNCCSSEFWSCLDKSNTLHALVSAKCQLPWSHAWMNHWITETCDTSHCITPTIPTPGTHHQLRWFNDSTPVLPCSCLADEWRLKGCFGLMVKGRRLQHGLVEKRWAERYDPRRNEGLWSEQSINSVSTTRFQRVTKTQFQELLQPAIPTRPKVWFDTLLTPPALLFLIDAPWTECTPP